MEKEKRGKYSKNTPLMCNNYILLYYIIVVTVLLIKKSKKNICISTDIDYYQLKNLYFILSIRLEPKKSRRKSLL